MDCTELGGLYIGPPLEQKPCLHRPQGQGQPQGTSHIDLIFSADAMEVISDLHSGSRPRAILKIRPLSSLDYRALHGPQTKGTRAYILLIFASSQNSREL